MRLSVYRFGQHIRRSGGDYYRSLRRISERIEETQRTVRGRFSSGDLHTIVADYYLRKITLK